MRTTFLTILLLVFGPKIHAANTNSILCTHNSKSNALSLLTGNDDEEKDKRSTVGLGFYTGIGLQYELRKGSKSFHTSLGWADNKGGAGFGIGFRYYFYREVYADLQYVRVGRVNAEGYGGIGPSIGFNLPFKKTPNSGFNLGLGSIISKERNGYGGWGILTLGVFFGL